MISGTEPCQRRLNGPQTSGRDYRNLSEPQLEATCDEDVEVPMRDGVRLLADVHRPTASVGTSCLNTIQSTSRLLVPVV